MNDEYFQLSQAFDGGVMAYRFNAPGIRAPYDDPKLVDSWNEGFAYAERVAFEDKLVQVGANLGSTND